MSIERDRRYLRAAIKEARHRANRLIYDHDGYSGASVQLVAECRNLLDALERMDNLNEALL